MCMGVSLWCFDNNQLRPPADPLIRRQRLVREEREREDAKSTFRPLEGMEQMQGVFDRRNERAMAIGLRTWGLEHVALDV